MRLVLAALIAATMVATVGVAHAQRRGTGGGGNSQEDAQKAEYNARKKQADERAYQDALKRIPASTEKQDPWKGAR